MLKASPFLSMNIDYLAMQAHLIPECSWAIMYSHAVLKEEKALPLKSFQNVIRLMPAALAVCHLDLLHIQPLKCWLKARKYPSHAWHLGSTCVLLSHECLEDIATCTSTALNEQSMGQVHRAKL